MFSVVAEKQVPYILMHMQGTPANMQENPSYQNVTMDIVKFFSEKLPVIHELGVHDTIIDVGFGFGKTIEHNYEILNNQFLHHQILVSLYVQILFGLVLIFLN